MSDPTPFEKQHRRWRLVSYATAAVVMVATLLLAAKLFGALVGFILFTPMLAAAISWLLVNNATAGVRKLREEKWGEINGHYHAFDDLAVAVAFHKGQCQVAARDVFKVLGEEIDAGTLRRLELAYGVSGFFEDHDGQWWFGETALLEWLDKRARRLDRRAIQFRHWLARDVFPPLRRKHEAPNDAVG